MLSLGLSITSPAVWAGIRPLAIEDLISSGEMSAFLTHSRAGNAMQWDSAQKLTWAPNNLLLQSANPAASPWGLVQTSVTPGQADPDGGTSAFKIEATGTGPALNQNVFSAGASQLIFSAKIGKGSGATDANRFTVRNTTTTTDILTVTINYDTGALTYITGSTGATAESLGGGWYLLSMKVSSGFSFGDTVRVFACFNFATEVSGEYAYLYKPRLARVTYEATQRSQDDVDTTSAAYYGPRFDYDMAGSPLGLLIESARTSVPLWVRDFTNAAWTKTNITAAKDQTGITGVANSASSLAATAANGTALQAITLASSARFQATYVKRLTGTGVIEMTMDNGSTWTPITVTAAWTRVSIPTQTLANPTVGFRIVTSGDAIAVDFPQNENGAFATSPIWTTSAAVTRAADALAMALYSTNPIIVQTRSVADNSRSRQVINPASDISSLTDVWLEEIAVYPTGSTSGHLNSKLTVDGPY
jgi:hypothetical protein